MFTLENTIHTIHRYKLARIRLITLQTNRNYYEILITIVITRCTDVIIEYSRDRIVWFDEMRISIISVYKIPRLPPRIIMCNWTTLGERRDLFYFVHYAGNYVYVEYKINAENVRATGRVPLFVRRGLNLTLARRILGWVQLLERVNYRDTCTKWRGNRICVCVCVCGTGW